MDDEEVVSENELERRGEITFFNGEPFNGACVDYYENGQKESEVHYKDGKGDGLCENWYEDGQKESEGHFKDGKPDGSWTYWHENGKRSEMHFKDEKPDDL